MSEGLRQLILRLYDNYLTADGKALNYEALRADPLFSTYANATSELQKVDIALLNQEERMAFFINIYNAVVVHALAVFGPASNLQQRWGFCYDCILSKSQAEFVNYDIAIALHTVSSNAGVALSVISTAGAALLTCVTRLYRCTIWQLALLKHC